jgi:hypothetical protein
VFAALVVIGALAGARWGLVGVSIGVLGAMAVNFAMIFQLGERVTGLALSSFAGVHVPAAALTAIVGAEAWGVSLAARGVGTAPVVTLLAAALVVAPTLLLVVRLLPAVLGEDGRWLADLVCRSAPAPLAPMLRRTLMRAP